MLRYLKGIESKDKSKLENSLKQRHQLKGQWYEDKKVLRDKEKMSKSIEEMEIMFLTNEVNTTLEILTIKLKNNQSLDQTLLYVKEAQAKLKHLEEFSLRCVKKNGCSRS